MAKNLMCKNQKSSNQKYRNNFDNIFSKKEQQKKQPSRPLKIKSNKIQCEKCNDIIESKYRWDFQTCSCGSVSVDGGTSYPRRGGIGDYKELSTYFKGK